MSDSFESFESMMVSAPEKAADGSPGFLTGKQIAALARDPQVKTEHPLLLSIVKSRIHALALKGITEFRRPFDEYREHGFRAFIRPAADETKRSVLAELNEDPDYRVEGFGDDQDPDEAVIRW